MNIDQRYLLDTVVIKKLSKAQLSSFFVQEKARVPEEVLYECRGSNKLTAIEPLRYALSLEILRMAQTILENLDADDTIIDLFNNEGNGDIILLATALFEKAQNANQLFGIDWIIVTDDGTLILRAKEFDIPTLTSSEYILALNS